MFGRKLALTLAAMFAVLVGTTAANASLSTFQVFNGQYGVSTDGFGSISQAGTISASVPAGSTVVAAYLYSSTYFNTSTPGGTLNGSSVNYSANLGYDSSACCVLNAFRADVTGIVKPIIDGGAGGVYNFDVTETLGAQDGEGLVVVYSNPTLSTATVGILDGFSVSTGDSSTMTFSTALDPTASGFFAEMMIGDGFSCNPEAGCSSQVSTITVNGQTMTTVAGDFDDSADGFASNGNLITVGSYDDPFTVAAPGTPATDVLTDHEHYDLSPFINVGDTSIHLTTLNASGDDNIFLEVFHVLGTATVTTTVPEPATWGLMIVAFAGMGLAIRRRRVAA